MSSRKSNGALVHWPSIVISWVNLFEIESISKVSSIRNTNFIVETIETIFKLSGLGEISFKNSDDLAVKFVKEYFPEIIKEKKFYLKNEDDALILVSLLMYVTCIKYKIENFISKTSTIKLDDRQEEALKNFFERMLKVEDGQFTRKNILEITQTCFEPEVAPAGRKSMSPSQKNCLKEFLGSPSLQEKHKQNKEVNDMRHLNALLQEENAELLQERDFLTTQNQKLDATVAKLQTQLTEQSHEITSLKEELKQLEERGTNCDAMSKIEKQLDEEIHELRKELKDMLVESDKLHSENSKYIKMNGDLKQTLLEREADLEENFKIIEQLQNRLQDLQIQNKTLETSVKDLNQIIEQIDEKTPLKDLSLSCPGVEENLGQVLTDLELKEKNEEIERLQQKLLSLETLCKEKAEEIKKYEEREKSLLDELQSKCQIVENTSSALNDLHEKLDDYKAQLETQVKQSNDLKAEIENMGLDLSASLAANKDLEVRLEDSLKIIAQLNSDVAERESHIKEMKKSIDTLMEEKEEYRLKTTHLAEQLKKHEATEKKLQDKLQSKCSEVESTTSALNEMKNQLKSSEAEFKSQTKKLKTKCEILEQDLSVITSKHKEAEVQLANCLTSIAQLETVIVEKDQKIGQIEKIVATLSEEKNQYESRIANQAEKVKQLEELEEKLQEELQSQSLIVESKIDALNEVGNQLEILKAELLVETDRANQLTTASKSMENDLSASLARNSELEKQLSESLNNMADMEYQIACMKKVTEFVSEEKKDFELRIAQQDCEIKQLETSKRDLENHLESKNREFEELTRTTQGLQEQYRCLTQETVALQEKLSSALANVTELEMQLESQDRLKGAVEEKVSQLKECNSSLEMEKNELKRLMEDQVSHWKANISDLEAKIETKESECESLKKELDDIKTELSSTQSELSELHVKNQELNSQMSSVTTGAAHLENVIQEDNFKIDLQERTIRKLECSVEEKENTIVKLTEEISSLKLLNDEAKTLILEKDAELGNHLNTKNCEVEKLNHQIEALTKDIDGLHSILKPLEANHKETAEANAKLVEENSKLRSDLNERVDEMSLVEKELLVQKDVVLQLKNELDVQREKLQEAIKVQESVVQENVLLKAQVENADPQLKEAYQQLLEDYQRLSDENDEAKDQLQKVRVAVRAEYDEILKKMKAHMKSTCTRALEVKDEKHAKELKILQDTVKAHQDHNSQLSTNLWDTSDKLLITRNENEELRKENEGLKQTLLELKRMLHINQSIPEGLHRTRSHDQLGLQSQKSLRMVKEESTPVSRGHSARTVPSGIGKVFPSEDETGEVFNNDCLADLKAGRCQVKTEPDRLSTLMYRNSLCPPHLKSSYPAETQFLPADTLLEDDIKGRGLDDDTKLLPDKRRKDRSQTSELRNVAASPRTALKEVNDENRKPGTPSRLFSNIFSARQRRSENVSSTPDRRRLSFFGKLVKKEPSD